MDNKQVLYPKKFVLNENPIIKTNLILKFKKIWHLGAFLLERDKLQERLMLEASA